MAKERRHLPGTNTRFLKQLEQAAEITDLGGGGLGELRAFIPGTPAAGATLFVYAAAEHVKIPSSGNHQIYADLPPAADWTVGIGGGSGPIVAAILAGQTQGSFEFPMGDVYLAPGDILIIYAPTTADSSIGDIAITLQIERADPDEAPGPIIPNGGDYGVIGMY